jgi:hypothetical protein
VEGCESSDAQRYRYVLDLKVPEGVWSAGRGQLLTCLRLPATSWLRPRSWTADSWVLWVVDNTQLAEWPPIRRACCVGSNVVEDIDNGLPTRTAGYAIAVGSRRRGRRPMT